MGRDDMLLRGGALVDGGGRRSGGVEGQVEKGLLSVRLQRLGDRSVCDRGSGGEKQR